MGTELRNGPGIPEIITILKGRTIHIMPIKLLPEELRKRAGDPALILCSNKPSRLEKYYLHSNYCAQSFTDTEDADHPFAFRDGHAGVIKDFVISLPEYITDIFICCDGGDSRSPAITAALLLSSGADDGIIWKNPYYRPNKLVFGKLCAAFGINVLREDLLKRMKANESAFRQAMINGGTGSGRVTEIFIE